MKPAQKAWRELGWQVVGALLVAAAFAGLAARGESTRDLSPCAENPRGKACAEQRQAVARAEPIRNPCIEHQRVEGTRGRYCPRFFVRRHQDGADRVASAGAEGGEAQQSPHKGSQQHGPRGGGHHQGGGDPGAADPAPTSPAADPSPTGSSAGSPPSSTPPSSEHPKGPVEQAADSATDAVDQVKEATEEVGKTVCGTVPVPGCEG